MSIRDELATRHPGNAKLTEAEVREIKGLLSLGISQVNIAARFGVRQSTISHIKRGKTWSWVDATRAAEEG